MRDALVRSARSVEIEHATPAPVALADGEPDDALRAELTRLRDLLHETLRDLEVADLEAAWRRLSRAARPGGYWARPGTS